MPDGLTTRSSGDRQAAAGARAEEGCERQGRSIDELVPARDSAESLPAALANREGADGDPDRSGTVTHRRAARRAPVWICEARRETMWEKAAGGSADVGSSPLAVLARGVTRVKVEAVKGQGTLG